MMKTDGLQIDNIKLRTRFNAIRHQVERFWQNSFISHLTNHSAVHSENIHSKKLSSLVGQLPDKQQLSPDEVFIISAATFLYDTGMQSPDLSKVLGDFDLPLTEPQRQKVRDNYHELSYHLILSSVDPDYKGRKPELGLTVPPDDYVYAIAEVCRNCAENVVLEQIKEKFPVAGIQVRLRLLVALLRLADQLYIDSTRINMELLPSAQIPMSQKVHWWLYNYAETMLLENGLIHFYYRLPAEKTYLLPKIRAVLEPQFLLENNALIEYLLKTYNLQLRLDPNYDVLEQPKQFYREIGQEVEAYLRQEVKEMQQGSIDPDNLPKRTPRQRALFLLNYENLLLQLGKMGNFPTIDEIGRILIDLMTSASSQHYETFDYVAFGNWNREDMAPHAEVLKGKTFTLLTSNNSAVAEVESYITEHVYNKAYYNKLIIVTPSSDIINAIKEADSRCAVYTWIADLEEADIFRILQNFKKLHDLIKIPIATKMDEHSRQQQLIACLLTLDVKLIQSDMNIADTCTELSLVPRLQGTANWWLLYLLHDNKIHIKPDGNVELNTNDKSVIGMRHRLNMVLETFLAQADNLQLPQTELNARLIPRHFDSDEKLDSFLKCLHEIGLLSLDTRGPSPLWSFDNHHVLSVRWNEELYLSLIVIGIDHFLAGSGFPSVHDYTISRNLEDYMSETIARLVQRLALNKRLIIATDSGKQQHQTKQIIYNIDLNKDDDFVATMLLNRDILFDVMYHAQNGFERNVLVKRLSEIRSFKLSREHTEAWIDAFQRAHLIELGTSDDKQSESKALLKLNQRERTVQHVLGRRNFYGLIRNLRLMHATREDEAKPVVDLVSRLQQWVTFGDRQLAGWTLDAAKSIKMLRVIQDSNNDSKIDLVYLARHSFVRRLDEQERKSCEQIVTIIKQKANPAGGWVPLPVVTQAMENEWKLFGKSREEHSYWIDQANYRYRMIEKHTETGGHRRTNLRVVQRDNR